MKKFPKTTIQAVTAAHIGFKSHEEPAQYLARISSPEHDDSGHMFESSSEVPGVCKVCGWIHPDLRCTDCDDPVRVHAAQAALLCEATEGDQGDAIIIVVSYPSRGWTNWPFG